MPHRTRFGVEAGTSIGLSVSLCAALLTSGCSQADPQPTQVSPPAASVGDEPPPVPLPQKLPRGRIIVRAFVKDQPVAAHVRFLDVPRPIEGQAGESISAEAGTQRIEVSVSDASALLDRPSQLIEVFVAPSKESVAEARFPWARVRFDVMVQGRRQVGVPIKLLRKEVAVADLKSGAAAQVSPGKYEADVMLNGRALRARGLSLMDGATQNIPLQF